MADTHISLTTYNTIVTSETSSATPTVAIQTGKRQIHRLTAQAVDITSFTTNLTGTPSHGQVLIYEITVPSGLVNITLGSAFELSFSVAAILPSALPGPETYSIGCTWNAATSKFRIVAFS